MKRFIIIFLISSVFGGCTNELNLNPISNKNIDDFYKTEQQFEQAIIGCYNGLRSANLKQSYSFMLTEARSDNSWQQVDYDDGAISRFTETSALPVLNDAWSNLYNTIMRCNYILTNLETVELSADFEKKIEGEARFIRALIYFDLVRYFRGVPIIEKPLTITEAYQLKRSSEEEVYNFIIDDLKKSIELLPNIKPKDLPNRATVYAARGFLGKVYAFQSGYPLNKNSWSVALNELKIVLDAIGDAGFFDNYEDIFLFKNENKDQSIFSLGCKSNAQGEGNPYPTRNAPNGIKPGNTPLTIPFGGSPFRLFLDGDYIVNDIFFEDGDLRKEQALQFEWEEKSGPIITNSPYVKKYTDGPVSGGSDWDIDWIMLRYTDVYMLYAEALYYTGDKVNALNIINKVRNRAGLTALDITRINDNDQFVDILLKERRREFCFENQRWWDLVRTDKALDVMKVFLDHYGAAGNLTSKDQYFYPIPQRETDITGIE